MVAVASKFMLFPISVIAPPLVMVAIDPLVSTLIAMLVLPPPSVPVTETLPPPDVIVELALTTSTPLLLLPVPLPPWPMTVTAPELPAVI